MALPSDLSLIDLILEREDLIGLTEKDASGRNEYNDYNEINVENWPTNADDLLDSMLKFEDQSFGMLNADLMPDFSMANSSSSDSGLSSDQQMSPRPLEADDDDININLSEDNFCHVQNEIEVESSVLNSSGNDSLQYENDQAIINVLTLPEESEVTPTHSNPSNKFTSPSTTVLRVTPVSGNPRSVLLPVHLKNVRDIKTIKVINLSRTTKFESEVAAVPTKVTPIKTESPKAELNREGVKTQYPRLQLTSEEKRLLQKEGVRLPTHYPLTKHEERELKRIRRKIRNKISAQDSRKRKKEYIDGLEERVKQCTEENVQLVKRIKALQTQNQSLTAQLHRLQALVTRSTAKSVQPATCLMVLLLSMALVMAPNLRPGSGAQPDLSDLTEVSEQSSDQEGSSSVIAGPSRTLLFCKSPIGDEGCQVGKEELESLRHHRLNDHDYGPPASKYARIIPEHTMPSTPDVHPESVGPGVGIEHKILDYSHELKVNISEKGGPRTVTLQVPTEK